VVVYDRLAPEALLAVAPPTAERVYVGKRPGAAAMAQEAIHALLVDRARAGRTVVRLKGGDPFVFGRGGEEALALADAGVPFEVVPGVTAALAAAARAGIPATHRGLAGGVALVTGHEAPDASSPGVDFDALARWGGTVAVYMGVANLAAICRRLVAAGRDPASPAAVVERAATPRQRVVTGDLAKLPAAAHAQHVQPPAIVFVGPVVGLRQRLAWCERRPLFARRIVVTRPAARAAALAGPLAEQGAEVIEMPAIRIEPPASPAELDAAVAEAGRFDWIVFTSVHAVEALFAALDRHGRDARALAGAGLCAIGPATAAALSARGLRADAQPDRALSAAIPAALAERGDLAGARILYPRSDAAPPDLPFALHHAGADVRDVVAYRTVPDGRNAERVRELLGERAIDWITFTSASTVTHTRAAVGDELLRAGGARLASIGPRTSEALRAAHLAPAVEAETHTAAGLAAAIIEAERASAGFARNPSDQ